VCQCWSLAGARSECAQMRHLILSLVVAPFLVNGAPSLLAQHAQVPYERVLVPVLGTVNGAYGSIWKTEFIGQNESDEAVDVTSCPVCLGIPETPLVPPHSTFVPQVAPDSRRSGGGVFVYVGQPGTGKVTFNLRVQDTSRQEQTWGTSIPVVREKDVYTTTLHLLDVPVDPRFRSALRVYDFDTNDGDPKQVRVRVYDLCGAFFTPLPVDCPTGAARIDTVLTLTGGAGPQYPSTATVGDIVNAFPELGNVQPIPQPFGDARPAAVRIDIDPVTPNLRFWAFVSATNNATQHVTAILPSE